MGERRFGEEGGDVRGFSDGFAVDWTRRKAGSRICREKELRLISFLISGMGTARRRKNNAQRFVHDHAQTPPIAREPIAHSPNDLHSHVRVRSRDRVSQLLPVLISPREQALLATHDVLCRLAVELLLWRRGRGRVGLFEVDSVSFEERLTLGFEVGAVVRPVEVLEEDRREKKNQGLE